MDIVDDSLPFVDEQTQPKFPHKTMGVDAGGSIKSPARRTIDAKAGQKPQNLRIQVGELAFRKLNSRS
jgi:hypothetical protein